MDIADLQSRLTTLSYLLPSQRDWLERLLFQLAFNDIHYVEAVGPVGSGKTTLALALAELCSERYNVAIITKPVTEAELSQQLMHQWFSVAVQNGLSLAEQVEHQVNDKPLLLILDQAVTDATKLNKLILPLPCQVFNFVAKPILKYGLTLFLNSPGSADAEILLQSQQLNPLEISRRLAYCAGNLHLLLNPLAPAEESSNKTNATPSLKAVYAVSALIFILVLSYLLWPRPETMSHAKPEVEANKATFKTSEPAVGEIDKIAVDNIMSDQMNADQSQPETSDGIISNIDEPILAVDAIAVTPSEVAVEPRTSESQTAMTNIVDEPDTTTNIAQAVTEIPDPDQPESATNRLRYDEAALLAMDKQHYALQLAVLSNDAAVKRFNGRYPQLRPKVYQRNWQGELQLVLLLAPYSDAQAAKAQLSALPTDLRQAGPFVKRIQAVHTEISAKARSQQYALD